MSKTVDWKNACLVLVETRLSRHVFLYLVDMRVWVHMPSNVCFSRRLRCFKWFSISVIVGGPVTRYRHETHRACTCGLQQYPARIRPTWLSTSLTSVGPSNLISLISPSLLVHQKRGGDVYLKSSFLIVTRLKLSIILPFSRRRGLVIVPHCLDFYSEICD